MTYKVVDVLSSGGKTAVEWEPFVPWAQRPENSPKPWVAVLP